MDMTRERLDLKKYIFYWLDGKVEESMGVSVSEAFMRLGYERGAMAALDYFKEVRYEN